MGESKLLRAEAGGYEGASHTEFTRILAEHGLLGIFALVVLGVGITYNVKRQKMSIGKTLMVGAAVWSSLFMMNAGMRLAMPSFMLGLSFLIILTPQVRKRLLKRNSTPNRT